MMQAMQGVPLIWAEIVKGYIVGKGLALLASSSIQVFQNIIFLKLLLWFNRGLCVCIENIVHCALKYVI